MRQDEDGGAIEAMWDPTKPQSLRVSTALAAAGVGASDLEALSNGGQRSGAGLSTSPPDSWETLEAGETLYEGAVALPSGPPIGPGETRMHTRLVMLLRQLLLVQLSHRSIASVAPVNAFHKNWSSHLHFAKSHGLDFRSRLREQWFL